MTELTFESVLPVSLAEIWEMFQRVDFLPELSPPKMQVTIDSIDLPFRIGTKLVLSAKGPLGRIHWVAKIVEHRPPHAVVFGEEARFVDEQESGPFKYWRHEHEFEAQGEKSTRLIDRVHYKVGWGPIGWLANQLIVKRELKKMFLYRHELLRKRFASSLTPSPSGRGLG